MKEDRQKIWDEYKGNKPDTIRHNFCDYDRYFEANLISEELKKIGVDTSQLTVLDFGCCAGDYGMYFARQGSKVCFIDIDSQALDFVNHRASLEHLQMFVIFSLQLPRTVNFDLAIFGEVLEHCDDAFDLLYRQYKANAQFIFTSSYPYRSDDAEDSYWKGRGHSSQARLDQELCRVLLNKYYNRIDFEGARKLWIRKKSEEL